MFLFGFCASSRRCSLGLFRRIGGLGLRTVCCHSGGTRTVLRAPGRGAVPTTHDALSWSRASRSRARHKPLSRASTLRILLLSARIGPRAVLPPGPSWGWSMGLPSDDGDTIDTSVLGTAPVTRCQFGRSIGRFPVHSVGSALFSGPWALRASGSNLRANVTPCKGYAKSGML